MSADWYARARAILNRDWDPIHLSRMPDADEWNWADEYDLYRNILAVLIRSGATDSVLHAFLEWAEVEAIELGGVDHDRNAKVIAALRELGPPPPAPLRPRWPERRGLG
jgi:hypothetical protein